jgi:hypothetical protein
MPDKKFINVRVRAGFVVTFEEKVKQGDKIVTREQQYYPEDGDIQLDTERVLQHAHKLEPADGEATAFLEQLHIKFDPPAGPAAVDTAAIASQAAAAAVKATLDALGVNAATLGAAMAAKAGKAPTPAAP